MISSSSNIAAALLALLPNVAFAVPKAIFESTKTYGAIPISAAFEYSPAPTYNPQEHLKLVNLFKRGCTLPQGGTCYDGNACCNNPKDAGDGWCCGEGKICGNGNDGAYCGYSTLVTALMDVEIKFTDNSQCLYHCHYYRSNYRLGPQHSYCEQCWEHRNRNGYFNQNLYHDCLRRRHCHRGYYRYRYSRSGETCCCHQYPSVS